MRHARVNRLIVIAYDGKACTQPYQQLHQLVLAGVGITVFIHQQVTNFILPALAYLFIPLKQQRRQQDQIVEIGTLQAFMCASYRP